MTNIIFPKIENKTILYVIIFFLILFISYVKNELDTRFKFLATYPIKIIILILIILMAEENIQLSLVFAVIYVIITMTNEETTSTKETK